MLADDDNNPYRASSADLNSPEPLEPLTPLPAETPTQRRGKWLVAIGITGALYGTALAAAIMGVVAVFVAVAFIGLTIAGFVMCRATPIVVEEND